MNSSFSHLLTTPVANETLVEKGYYHYSKGQLLSDTSSVDEDLQDLLESYAPMLKAYNDVWMKPILANGEECACVETYWTVLVFVSEESTVKSIDVFLRYMSSSPYWGVPDSEVAGELQDAWLIADRIKEEIEEDLAR